MTNILTAPIGANRMTKTRPLYQYDYGQVLKLTGIDLPAAYEVHFSNSEFGESTTQIGNADGVLIPDAYLQSGADVYVWLYLHSGIEDGETVYKILIPVQKRAAITPEQPTPVQQDAITQAIAALNDAVEQTAQDVEDAEAAAETARSAAASAHNNALAAGQSAEAAAESAFQAVASARTATAKASEAAQSATAAETAHGAASASATTAQTAATTASGKADEAARSANTASGKAADAANSANAAQSAANSAAAAQSAAETARSAAETAQAAAETVADEVESSIEDAQDIVEAAETLMILPATGGESAPVATITDAANDQPMALKIGIEPVQAGSGTPSPDNVRPISGWTRANVTRTGKNVLRNMARTTTVNGIAFFVGEDGTVTVNGTATSNAVLNINTAIGFLKPNTRYIINGSDNTSTSGTYRLQININNNTTAIVAGGSETQFTTPDVINRISIYIVVLSGNTVSNGVFRPMIRLASNADPTFEPYKDTTYDIAFPAEAGMVYGGTLEIAQDGTGTLTVDKAYADLGTLDWSYNASLSLFYSNLSNAKFYNNSKGGACICSSYDSTYGKDYSSWSNFPNENISCGNNFSIGLANLCVKDTQYTDAATFKTAMDGVQLVYELATPQVYTFTAGQVKSLLGINNVWADCGNMQINAYFVDKTLLITKAEQRIENLTVSAETLSAGSPASVEKQESANGINLHFGIPKGADGQGGGVTDVQVNGQSVVQDGVANVPIASHNNVNYGVVKLSSSRGLTIDTNGELRVNPASSAVIKSGASEFAPLAAYRIREGVFWGLAKAAGYTVQSEDTYGTYTETAKSKISDMLSAPVSVTGTTPTITALSGIQYVCGEVSTLDITLPESGIVDVVFQSGSTPTVLTITPPTGVTVKWANGFDPTALEANTTYEINVFDGAYAKVTHWNNAIERKTPVVLYDTTFAENIGSSTPFTTMVSITDVDGVPLSAFGITKVMITCITPTDPNNAGLWPVLVALNEDSFNLPSPNSRTSFAINPNNINKKCIQLLTDDFAIIWGISAPSYGQGNMFMSGADMDLNKNYHSKYINKIMIGTSYPNGSIWLANTRLHIIGW